MKKFKVLPVILILCVIAFGFVVAYRCFFPVVSLVEDQAFDALYPERAKIELKWALLKKGIRVNEFVLGKNDITDSATLEEKINSLGSSKAIVLSPLAADAVKAHSSNMALDLENVVLISMNISRYDGFDCVMQTLGETITTTQTDGMTAVLNNEIEKYDFENGISYAVDYRYSGAVPEKSLGGVFAPDLTKCLIPLLDYSKEDIPETGILVYEFYKVRRKIF